MIATRLIEEKWEFRVIDESSDNHDTLAVLPKTGDEEFDKVIRKRAELVAQLLGGKPAVLITVSGGVADYSATDGVQVVHIDYDNLKESTKADAEAVLAELATLPANDADFAQAIELTIRDVEDIKDGLDNDE